MLSVLEDVTAVETVRLADDANVEVDTAEVETLLENDAIGVDVADTDEILAIDMVDAGSSSS